jgi:signal transduction histidine kinase
MPDRTAYPRPVDVERGLLRWAREHPTAVDVGLAGVAALASVGSVFYVAEVVGWPAALVLHIVPPVVLLARRRSPAGVLAILLGLDLVGWALAAPMGGAQVSSLIALYTVARHGSRPVRAAGLAATLVLVALAPLRQPDTGISALVLAALTVLVVHVLGTNVELRAEYLRALEERAARADQERDAAAAAAAVEERVRIAREMHDVVAHHVSVMVVQAEGAGWAVDGDPEGARTAVAAVADTGRATLTELRRMLGVMRDGGGDGREPQPGIREIPGLVASFRSGGLAVDLQDDAPPGLPASLQLAVYRIVQEGLTNVLKHAGPGTRVRVRTAAGAGEVVVHVQDDGPRNPAPVNAPGHGLIGIRERAAVFGGQVVARPRAAGGFELRVAIPWS